MIQLNKNIKFIDWIKQRLAAEFNNPNERPISAMGSVLFVVLAGLVALYLQTQKSVPKEKVTSDWTIDKDIPDGFALVPIDIINYESLDSLVGPLSVVDIFSVPIEKSELPKRVAYLAKLVRSPKNPSHFNILIKADRVPQLYKIPGPYRVVVRNPNFQAGTKFEKEKQRVPGRIRYIVE